MQSHHDHMANLHSRASVYDIPHDRLLQQFSKCPLTGRVIARKFDPC
jgi:hypothetical protein